jgi:alpha-L-arabinofuranosidase
MIKSKKIKNSLQEHIDKTKKHTRMKTQIGMDFEVWNNFFFLRTKSRILILNFETNFKNIYSQEQNLNYGFETLEQLFSPK